MMKHLLNREVYIFFNMKTLNSTFDYFPGIYWKYRHVVSGQKQCISQSEVCETTTNSVQWLQECSCGNIWDARR